MSSIPGLGRSSEEGNGNPLQYSCLENPMDREVWLVTVQNHTESDTAEAKLAGQQCDRDFIFKCKNVPCFPRIKTKQNKTKKNSS